MLGGCFSERWVLYRSGPKETSVFLFNVEVVSVYLSPTKNLIPNQVATSSISNLTSNFSWLPSSTPFPPSRACLQPWLHLCLPWVAPCESPLSVSFASPGWAHVVCALYIPEVQFANVLTMEPIVLQYVPHDRFNKVRPPLSPAAPSVFALP